MKRTTRFTASSARLLAAACLLLAAGGAHAQDWIEKVDPWVVDTASRDGETEFLVFLAEQADLTAAAGLSTKSAKGWYVFETLSKLAERTQAPVLSDLARAGVEHRSYWVANMIWVRGDMNVVERMARRGDVGRVVANPTVKMDLPHPERTPRVPYPGVGVNIDHTEAPSVFWDNGVFGQGAVIGGQDTGYDWDHPALILSYRGNKTTGGGVIHDYSWHDSIHSGGGVCGANSPEPCDDNGHGTHTMGTMTGYDGGTNWVGMAPGARWIGCRNMDRGNGTPTTYSECFQWFIAPTTVAGTNPDPTMAPDVINNSWSCPPSEGCNDPNVMLTVVNNVRAAGITVVVSAGNAGPSCSSVNTPAAIYDASFTVGATNNFDNIASFSSRGPVTVDGSNRLKPEISAPGVSVRSAARGGGYTNLSGTSMAGPHVAGMAGLLVSAAPCWAGDVDTIEQHMIDSALPRTSGQTCGGIPGSNVPNNTYGYGAMRSELPAATCSGLITLSTTGPWVAGGTADLVASGLTPGEEIIFVTNQVGPGQGVCPPILGGLCTDLREPFQVHGPALANGSGVATKTIQVPNTTSNVYSQAFLPRGANSQSTNLVVVQPTEP